jgi:hypothetical protein
MRSGHMWRGAWTIMFAAVWAGAGCAGSRPDGKADAGESVLDAGASDAGDAGDAVDAGRDAMGDGHVQGRCWTPAACEDGDGGIYQPPWGCPEICAPGCEGDTMCSDLGVCRDRCDCFEWCEVELTVRSAWLYTELGAVRASVCNRGGTTAGKGSFVAFEVDGELLCEATVAESLEPCECVGVICEAYPSRHAVVRATLHMNPDEQFEPCGNPLGHTTTSIVGGLD